MTETRTIESLEAADASWWVVARGSRQVPLIANDEDMRSIVASGDVRVANTLYARRYVGYGRIAEVVTPAEIIGTDEATDQPIISDAAVQRLAADATVRVR